MKSCSGTKTPIWCIGKPNHRRWPYKENNMLATFTAHPRSNWPITRQGFPQNACSNEKCMVLTLILIFTFEQEMEPPKSIIARRRHQFVARQCGMSKSPMSTSSNICSASSKIAMVCWSRSCRDNDDVGGTNADMSGTSREGIPFIRGWCTRGCNLGVDGDGPYGGGDERGDFILCST